MNYKHPNLFVMIPYEERNRVSGYFDLSVVGEEYAKLLGDLTDELSTYAVSKNDVGENAVIIPILRAGMSMSNRLTKRLPKADVARISMRRNLHTLKPFVAWDEFEQIKEPESKRVFITDPALATAGSILKTLEHMKKYGFKDENVVIMAMFGCQSGIERIFKRPGHQAAANHHAAAVRVRRIYGHDVHALVVLVHGRPYGCRLSDAFG